MRANSTPSTSPDPTTRRRLRFSCALLLLAALGTPACETSVPATNPYDPGTDPERQAASSLGGRLVLDDTTASREALIGEMSLAKVGLIGPDGSVVRAVDGSLVLAVLEVVDEAEEGDSPLSGLAAAFEFRGLTPGTYRLRVEGIGRRYAPPGMPEVQLRPGAQSYIGDLVFVSVAVDGAGPGTITGTVRLEGGAGSARNVELYRMEGGRAQLFSQRKTDTGGSFSFEGLPIGAYALAAALEGFTPDYRMDVGVGETGGATLMHQFTGDDSMVLHPVTAVLIPSVQQTESVYYTREDDLPLAVLAFGGVTSMRLATNTRFVNEEEGELPFVPYSASTVVPLPAEEGQIEVFAQFETHSSGGFVFVSPTFSTTVVRDATPPIVQSVVLPGEARNADGSFFVTPRILNVSLDIDAVDQHSAIAGIAVVQPEDNEEPLPESLVFENVTSSGGLVRVNKPVPLNSGDGERHVFVYARDRAGNVSQAHEVVLRVDTSAPALPLAVANALGGQLRNRLVELEFDEAGEEDLPVTMQVGIAPLRSGAPVVPYEPSVTLMVTEAGHGSVVAFEARLTDLAGNSALVRSDSVDLVLTGTLSGSVSVEGVPSLRPNHGGVRVRLFGRGTSLLDPPVAQTTTGSEGTFVIPAVPEGDDYLLVADLEGYVLGEQNVHRMMANQALMLAPMVLRLTRGELVGRFQLADEPGDAPAHGGILVRAVLGGLERSMTLTAITDEDGSWRLFDVPGTRLGEQWNVEGIASQNYSKGYAGNVDVAHGLVTVVQPDPGSPGIALPVLLNPISGDFDLCAPTGNCIPLAYTNLPDVRIRLRNAAGVSHLRARARDPFGAGDDEPAFVPFDPLNWPLVNIEGDDGQVVVYVQTIVEDAPGPVLSSTLVRDTVPPEILSFTIESADGALRQGFTSSSTVRAALHGDNGGDGSIPISPLANARMVFSGEPPLAPPPGSTSCADGLSCEVALPLVGGQSLEGEHRLYGFACDMAGNCTNAPAVARVVHDRTRPSAVHGVAIRPSGGWVLESGGKTYTRSSNYHVEIDLGQALTALGDPVLGLDGEAMPDVLAYRLSIGDPVLQGTTIAVLEGTLLPGATRVVQGPPLPPQDGEYTIYGQLVDAAGNRTQLEPNPFSFALTLDTTPPPVSFSLDNGATVTADETVTLTPSFDLLDRPVRVELAQDGGLFETVEERQIPFALGDDTIVLPAAPAPGGDGVYTVHARFHDAAGNVSQRQASIRLDRTAPSVRQVRCTGCNSVDGALYTNDPNGQVVLDILAEDSGGPVVGLVITAGATVQNVSYGAPVAVFLPGNQDGEHVVGVVAIDEAGNQSEALITTITLDRAPPNLVLQINDGDAYATSSDVILNIDASDPGSGLHGLRISSTNVFNGSVLPFEGSKPYRLDNPLVDGVKLVYVEVRDRAGNVAVASDDIQLDTSPPSGTIVVAGGAEYTNTRTVEVTLTYPADTVEYALGNESLDCLSASHVAAAGTSATFSHTLLERDGAKLVLACFKDAAGNRAQAGTSIVLDETPPTGAIHINNGAAFTTDPIVNVNLTAPSDTTSMVVLESADVLVCTEHTFEAFQNTKSLSLSAADGAKLVRACFRDGAGNTAQSSAGIVLNRTPPTGTLTLAGGASYTRTHSVVAALTAASAVTEISGMALAASASLDCGAAQYEPFLPERSVTLTEGEGQRWVSVCLREQAGLTTMLSESIIVDTTPPTGTITVTGVGLVAGYTSTREVTVALSYSADTTHFALAEGAIDCQSAQYAPAAASGDSSAFLLSQGDGQKTVIACLKDQAGNVHATSASIHLDTVAPWGSFQVAEGDWIKDRTITLQLSATGATRVRFGEDGCHTEPETYSATKSFLIPSLNDGFKTINVQYLDDAGNESACLAQVVYLDTFIADFTVGLVGSDGYTGITGSQAVTVSLLGVDQSDATEMRVSNLESFSGSTWEALAVGFPWFLHSGDGTKNVFVAIRDAAGNTKQALATITLDQTPPNPPALQVTDIDNDGFALDASGIELRWSVPSGTNTFVLERMMTGVDGDFVDLNLTLTQANFEFRDEGIIPGRRHSYRVKALDAVGNESDWSMVAVAFPYEPLSEATWIRDGLGEYRYDFRVLPGTFSLSGTHSQETDSGVLVTQLVQNQAFYERQRDPSSYNESFELRLANSDNSLVYDVDLPLDIQTRVPADAGPNVGGFSSLALDASGKAHISHYDSDARHLKYTTNASGEWISTTVDEVGSVGEYSSLALDASGRAHISYFDRDDRQLKYATNASGTWVMEIVDTAHHDGGDTSIAIDAFDYLHISYRNAAGHIGYATGVFGYWEAYTVDTDPDTGLFNSIAVDSLGKVHISFTQSTSAILRHGASWDGAFWVITNLDSVSAGPNSIAIDSHDRVHIAYRARITEFHLRYVNDLQGGFSIPVTVDDVSGAGHTPSIAVDAARNVHISHQDILTRALRYSTNVSGDWQSRTIDGRSERGESSSIALDASGRPHISYMEKASGALEYIVLSSPLANRLDSTQNVGGHNSLAVGADGSIHVSYYNGSTGVLQYATNRSGAWRIVTVDSLGMVGLHNSIALDSSGFAHISYRASTEMSLKYATNRTGTWQRTTIDSSGDVGENSSIAIDANDRVHISYSERLPDRAKYATNASGVWVSAVVGTCHFGCVSTSIAVDSAGAAHLAYYYLHDIDGAVRYATNSSGSWIFTDIDSHQGPSHRGCTSIVLDQNDKAHVSYYRGRDAARGSLSYATNASGAWLSATVDASSRLIGQYSSLTLDQAGNVHISYLHQYFVGETEIGKLLYATNSLGGWNSFELTESGNVGERNAIGIDSTGKLHISYYDFAQTALMYAKEFNGTISTSGVEQATPW